jgi:tRNA(fMet)-specific endonuclease VapC
MAYLLDTNTVIALTTFSSAAAAIFGEIRAHLARRGSPIGPYDLQVAAVARARSLVLVTNNGAEFSRVPGLTVKDWTE